MQLTTPPTTYSIRGYGALRSQPAGLRRVGGLGRGLPRLSGVDPLARWLRLSLVWSQPGLAVGEGLVSVWALSQARVGDLRNPVPRHALSAAGVVPGHLVCDWREARGQRAGAATGAGAGQLSYRLGLAASAAAGDGAPRPGEAERHGAG